MLTFHTFKWITQLNLTVDVEYNIQQRLDCIFDVTHRAFVGEVDAQVERLLI